MILLALLVVSAPAQPILTTSGLLHAGQQSTVTVSAIGFTAAGVTAFQAAFPYPAGAAVTAAPTATLSGAGKFLTCAASAASLECVVYAGINSLPDGPLMTLSLVVPAGMRDLPAVNALGADAVGEAVTLSTHSTVTVWKRPHLWWLRHRH